MNYARSSVQGYKASVQLIVRQVSGGLTAKWNYQAVGNEPGKVIEFRKVSSSVCDLYARSPGTWGILSLEISLTEESSPIIINIPSSVTIADPDSYEEVPVAGDFTIFSGNVGIGTTNSNNWKLAVNGNIRAKEIKVETGWSDFVFEDSYNLPTLEEVEQHIKEKGHLKDIPSAKEVEENGIFLGEMDAKLLQKIEELTLYMIELKKENQQLRKEIDELKKP
ncbi:hypothetical protein [Sinomicrobium sp. M5D2P17]